MAKQPPQSHRRERLSCQAAAIIEIGWLDTGVRELAGNVRTRSALDKADHLPVSGLRATHLIQARNPVLAAPVNRTCWLWRKRRCCWRGLSGEGVLYLVLSSMEVAMRGGLLWLLGIPIPVIILLYLFHVI
jgi:hypothetical protein